MPTGPLYYQPLVRAEILATPVGDSDVQALLAQQLSFDFVPTPTGEHQITASHNRVLGTRSELAEQFLQHEVAQEFAKTMTGIERLQQSLPGSVPFTQMKLAFDEQGWIANRVETVLEQHPDLLDTVSPAQAAELGAKLVQQAAEDRLATKGLRAYGATLEVDEQGALAFEAAWSKQEMSPEQGAWFAHAVSRELQRAVTPTPAGSTSPAQWLEEGSVELLGLWPGRVGATAQALGLGVDPAEAEKIADTFRSGMFEHPEVGAPTRSVAGLLGLAGVSADSADAFQGAFGILQGSEHQQVPLGIGQAIVAAHELDADRTEWLATRVIDTGGNPRNVEGLAAQVRELSDQPPPAPPPPPGPAPPPAPPPPPEPAPPPAEPPPTEPPPTEPPPTEPPPTEPPA